MTTALVTGANRGLGLAVAEGLARRGATVLLTGRDLQRATDAAARLRSEGLAVEPIQLDVTSPDSVSACAASVAGRGGLDVLVNNVGILPEAVDGEAHEFTGTSVFEQTFRVNLFGAVAVTEALLPLIRRSAQGRIVNVSTTMGSLSDQADPASPFHSMVVPGYQASKAALNSVTIALAKTLAGTEVVVTSVCPGFVQTELTPINREQAPLTPEQAAAAVIDAACAPPGTPSGRFVDRPVRRPERRRRLVTAQPVRGL